MIPLSRLAVIEPLEARIAPALLVEGANLLGGSSPHTGETSVDGDSVTLVKVLSGQALVWFHDGSITAISFGNNTSLEITGDIAHYELDLSAPTGFKKVFGDIVGNLMPNGRLSDSDNDPSNGEDGAVLLANNLIGLKTGPLSTEQGSVRAVITGGSVANVAINGEANGIYAGDGIFNTASAPGAGGAATVTVDFDHNPVQAGAQTTFSLALGASPDLVAGASIKNVTIQKAREMQIISGSGDPDRAASLAAGAAGGNIENIKINSAVFDSSASGSTPSYALIAGDGQAGKTGGAGGSILTVIEKASSGAVLVQAGAGGRGNAGVGGAGGSVRNLDMQSDGTNYTVTAGAGGQGVGGGAGGSALNNNFANRTPSNSVLISADFDGDGFDDVLVVDSSSSTMVLSRNIADGSGFEKVEQYRDDNDEPVTTIGGLGTTPVDGYATDFDGDGDQDVVIAYSNTASLGVFFNDGDGSFYKNEDGVWVIDGFSTDLGFAPSLISPATFGESSSSVAILSTVDGKTTAFFAVRSDDRELSLFGNGTELKRFAADIVATRGSDSAGHIFVGTQDGVMLELSPLGDAEGPAFKIVDPNVKVAGGISRLDVSSDGAQLLALNSTGRGLGVFAVGEQGSLTAQGSPTLPATGRVVAAQFVENASGDDSIALLSALAGGSRFDVFSPAVPDDDPLTNDPAYALTQTFTVQPSLKNFVVVSGGAQPGYAGVAGALNQFYHSRTLSDLTAYSLPFEGKKVSITAGAGGDAFDLGKVLGKGGLGGSVAALNVEANEIRVIGGAGGDSVNGAAGSAGSVSNPAQFTSASGTVIAPALLADEKLEITLGNGGTPTGPGSKSASGGHGGSLTGVRLQLASGEVRLFSGAGGNAKGGAAGNGGDIAGVSVTTLDGSLTLETGSGGNAPSGKVKGGSGGSVKDLSFSLELNAEAEKLENSYFVSIRTGPGGDSTEGQAGSGGAIANTTLKLDGADRTYDDAGRTPPLVDTHRDSTVSIFIQTGAGGDGALGGHGGALTGITSASVFDQVVDGGIFVNFVVATITAGAGGTGSAGLGGNGGGIAFGKGGLSGLTGYDNDAATPADNAARTPLRITAGAGGQGSTKGGAGGGISDLVAKNAPFIDGSPIKGTQLGAAELRSGAGGAGLTLDGGKGGDVTKQLIGVQGGALLISTGAGGSGGASGKGGNGGAITSSNLGAVDVGLALFGGAGGAGGKGGGNGGGFSTLELNTPQLAAGYAAVLVAGAGGAASGAGAIGGAGGSITKISQSKDVNSAINILEAGAGGASLSGKGGVGGSITALKTVGFIGRPTAGGSQLGVFDENGLPQGLFAGRGGDGLTDGVAGSVTGIAARQIAAIAAAYDATAGTFGLASKVAQITASLIGYEVVRNNVFADVNGGSATPSGTTPADGFILAAAITSVNTLRPGFSFTA